MKNARWLLLVCMAGPWQPCRAAVPDKKSARQRVLNVIAELDGLRDPKDAGKPYGMVGRQDGQLLEILTRGAGTKKAVEVGTGVGYSALWMSAALMETGGKLTTMEIDPKLAALARRNFEKAGVASLATVVQGNALRKIPELPDNTYDFAFIDGWKPQYRDYFVGLFSKMKVGSLIAAHDVWGMPDDMREFIDMLKVHPCIETVMLSDRFHATGKPMTKEPGVGLMVKRCADGKFEDKQGDYRSYRVPAPARSAHPALPYRIYETHDGPEIKVVLVLTGRHPSSAELAELSESLVASYKPESTGRGLKSGDGRSSPLITDIHVFDDEAALEHRNDLSYPAEKYFKAYLAKIRIQEGPHRPDGYSILLRKDRP